MDVYKDARHKEVRVVIDHSDELDKGLIEAIRLGQQTLQSRHPMFRVLPEIRSLAIEAFLDRNGPKPIEERAATIVRRIERDGRRSNAAVTEFKDNKAKLAHRLALRGISAMTDRRRADKLFDHITYHQA